MVEVVLRQRSGCCIHTQTLMTDYRNLPVIFKHEWLEPLFLFSVSALSKVFQILVNLLSLLQEEVSCLECAWPLLVAIHRGTFR